MNNTKTYDWTKETKSKKITFDKILDEYNIEKKELLEIVKEFGLNKAKIPVKFLDELIKVTVTTPLTEHSYEQNGHSWYRIGWIMAGIKYGDMKWITKSEFKVIDRLAIPWINKNGRKIQKRDGTIEEKNDLIFKRFNIQKIYDLASLKKKRDSV